MAKVYASWICIRNKRELTQFIRKSCLETIQLGSIDPTTRKVTIPHNFGPSTLQLCPVRLVRRHEPTHHNLQLRPVGSRHRHESTHDNQQLRWLDGLGRRHKPQRKWSTRLNWDIDTSLHDLCLVELGHRHEPLWPLLSRIGTSTRTSMTSARSDWDIDTSHYARLFSYKKEKEKNTPIR